MASRINEILLLIQEKRKSHFKDGLIQNHIHLGGSLDTLTLSGDMGYQIDKSLPDFVCEEILQAFRLVNPYE